MQNKAFSMVSALALFVAIFAAPAPALAQSYGYGYQTQQTGWGYNPYTTQGMYSYYSPLAQYGYGNGYNPGQTTYTGQGYGYGAYGYNGYNPYAGTTSYNNYNPYLNQGCSFYSYGYQPCQNTNPGPVYNPNPVIDCPQGYHSDYSGYQSQCVPNSSTNSSSLSATPTSGSAPLSVTFSTSGITDNRYFYTLDYGDGSTPATMTVYATTAQHTYTQAGTYTAALKVAPNQCYGAQVACTQPQPTTWTTVGTVTITVAATVTHIDCIQGYHVVGTQCVPDGSTSSSNFSATPASGNWPLKPAFTATNLDSAGTYYVDFGDRSGSQWLTKNGTTGTISHVYYITGTFTATLVKVTCNGAAYTSSCSNPTQTPIATASISVN